MKKAFTLVELIGVVLILALICLLAFPSILRSLKNAEGTLNDSKKEFIYSETNKFLYQHENYYKKTNGTVYCLQLRTLADMGYIDKTIHNNDDNILNDYVEISVIDNKYNLEVVNSCTEQEAFTISHAARTLVLNNDGTCKTDGTTYDYMGGCYLKASPSVNLKNYIWYNGFLWRVMGINDDGSVKLITENTLTRISFIDTNETELLFENSSVNSWLNDYFYNKLSDKNNLKTNTILKGRFCQNIATDASDDENCTGGKVINRNVGIISVDEYNLSGGADSYLNNGVNFWTSSYQVDRENLARFIFHVSLDGTVNEDISIDDDIYGVRPVINVRSDVAVTSGGGTLNNYYILGESKDNPPTNLNDIKMGEYVNFNNKIYRVVQNGNVTKLILEGFYEEPEGTALQVKFGDDNIFAINSGIGFKLNNSVLDWLTQGNDQTKLKSVITNGKWYQKKLGYDQSYTISLDETGQFVEAKVGLIRVGEISFVPENDNWYWTLTQGDSEDSFTCWFDSNSWSRKMAVTYQLPLIRPVININNSLVSIVSGNGTSNDPYVITVK